MKRTTTNDALLGVARLVMDVSVRAADDLGGLSPVQLRALTALRQMRDANLAQLADDMGVTVSTASRLIDRLVAADWVHRTLDPHNRRQVILTLTDDGKNLLRKYDGRRVARLRECLDRLPADRQESVIEALTDLVYAKQP